jgi:hypothetical protein
MTSQSQLAPNPEIEGANDLTKSIAAEQPADFKYGKGSSLPDEFTDHTRISTVEQEWIQKISEAWQRTVAGVLETGGQLLTAKKVLLYGDFGRMIKDKLPFSARTAQMLMKIAEDERIARLDAKRVSLLPPHWGTLHALTQLDDGEFEERLAQGEEFEEMRAAGKATLDDLPKGAIHPAMTRADAKSSKPKRKRKSNHVANLVRLADRLVEVANECELPSEITASIVRVQEFACQLKDKHHADRRQPQGKPNIKDITQTAEGQTVLRHAQLHRETDRRIADKTLAASHRGVPQT